jgi:hypothetical protein
MDLTVLTSHMKCGKVKRQLTALTSLLAYVEENLLDIFTSFDLVSSIIDNGICADNGKITN